MKLYEHLFNEFANPLKDLNFKENEKGKNQQNSNFNSHEIVCKIKTRSHRKSGRILEYSITMLDKSGNPLILMNYFSDCKPYVPETVRYTEPTWKDFTDEQLEKAVKYLNTMLKLTGLFRIKPDRNIYDMLVFNDKFHLATRVKNELNELEHNLCITAYNYSLEERTEI